jgi:type I restriction enzyme S subunit
MSNRYGKLISGLPTDWPVLPLSRAAERIVSGGTPSRAVPAYWDGQIPWVTPGELTNLDRKYLGETREAISPQGLAASGATLLPRDSLMVTTRATLGSVALTARPTATNQGFKSVVFGKSGEPSFYFHYFRMLLPELIRRSSGTTFLEISAKQFGQMMIPVPPLVEQRRIAEILDTVDEAIRSTEQLIAKREKAKQGLLGDTFDKSHHARGGTIQWEYAPLGELLDHLIDYRGRTPRKLGMSWGGGNILALSANNVQMGGVDASREAYYGSERLYQIWMTRGPTRRGDVLITLEAPLGNVAQIPDDNKYILSQRVVLLRFAENRILNDFAYWYMRAEAFQRALVANSTGTTATGIRRARLEQIVMPIPNIQAQQRIAQSLFAIQGEIDCEQTVDAKLKQVRRGLMEDLLTGRVRVGASG